MIRDIEELNFPKIDGKQYATLTHATVMLADMGEKTITTQVRIDGDIVPDFSYDWEISFRGEKYIMPLRIPQGTKENTSLDPTVDLTFQHWAIYQLKRWPFVTIQPIDAGTYIADEEVASVQLNLKEFCTLFGQVLQYYYGDAIGIDLNPEWEYKTEPTLITISHAKIWNVLTDAFHDKYGVRWEIKASEDAWQGQNNGEKYVIKVGYPAAEVDHIFRYGFDGGLLKIERQVQSDEIRNMLKGRGGETNIPFRYFKDKDPKNPDFKPDPDWVKELANIYFPNLMPATFRSYVQGWKAAHLTETDAEGNLLYGGYKPVGESNAYSPWAYRKGFTDVKFQPVEFVADEIVTNPTAEDRQVEILPGYSPFVRNGSSLDKYGPLPDTLDNDENIYPTLQGTGLDIAVDVEQIESDDVEKSVTNDAVTSTFAEEDKPKITVNLTSEERKTVIMKSGTFRVEDGKSANIDEGPKTFSILKEDVRTGWFVENGRISYGTRTFQVKVDDDVVEVEDSSLTVVNTITGEELPASGIPGGTYYFRVTLSLHNTSKDKLTIVVSCDSPVLSSAIIDDSGWKNTFDIWVKNIWNSDILPTETPTQYSERVWKPILGDREGNEAKVVFTSGALAHEDYEFKIPKGAWPVYDTSKVYKPTDAEGNYLKDENGKDIVHTSHWRIRLAKSDAEMEATGLYVPSTQKQGKAGDTFVFINTEMVHVPYVTDAERRLDDSKKDHLGKKKEIKPTCVVTTDRVRLNNEGKPDALIHRLRPGNTLRLYDRRFFPAEEGKSYQLLYLQSITYTYREPTSDDAALNPDVEIVLGNEYEVSANPVTMMQGEISALQRQVGSISNIEQIVRAVGDSLYLRKDGISDRSLSPTQFFSLLTSGDFRPGLVGGAGWGFYKDEKGNWVVEADRVNARQEMGVNNLVINQVEGRGGMDVDTAAYIKVTMVIETPDSYICHFDQKNGTVANLFHVGDVAYNNRWTAENSVMKFYKRRVTATDIDSITLTKGLDGDARPADWTDSGANGTGVPAEGDVIIHFGSYTDPARQYVKVRDVVGGGYERYIDNLDSVNAEGVEYYFSGKQEGVSRWFVGHKDLEPYSGKGDGSYIEYINRKLNLNNVSLSVRTTIGDKSLDEYFSGLVQGKTIYARGTGYNNSAARIVRIDGKDVKLEDSRGLALTVIDRGTLEVVSTSNYDIFGSEDDRNALADALRSLGSDVLVVVTSYNAWEHNGNAGLIEAMFDFGGSQLTNAVHPNHRCPYVLIGMKGLGRGNGLECMEGTAEDDPYAEISTTVVDGICTGWNINQGVNRKVDSFDYLRAALRENTTVTGGLVLASVVALGINNDDYSSQQTWSGISGLYDPGKPGGGIAAFYGGDMIDKAEYYDWNEELERWVLKPGADVSGLRIAAGLDRMDGTGYRANGNFWWDADGKIHADPLSFFVGEETVGNILGLFRYYPADSVHFDEVTAAEPQRPFTRLRLGTSREDYVELTYADGALQVDRSIVSKENILAFGNPGGEVPPGLAELLKGYATKQDLASAISGIDTGLDITALESYLTENRYATQDWVLSNADSYTKKEIDAMLGDGSVKRLGTADVGAANLPVYLDKGIPKAVTSVGDAFLSWGGKNLSNGVSPVDAAMNLNIGVNRFAFLREGSITVEYTEDGETWLDYGATAAQINSLFNGNTGANLTIGKGSRTDAAGLRITVDGVAGHLYCDLRKIMVFVSTSGSIKCRMKVEAATDATPDTWTELGSSEVSGWSGWNTLNIPSIWFGSSSSGRHRFIRFTFSHQGISGDYGGLQVLNISGYGPAAWITPSNMARNGHIYSYDASQNVTFPGNVTADVFAGVFNGNASSATKLQTGRYIFGQYFDGTKNISGVITGITGIYPESPDTTYIGSLDYHWRAVFARDFLSDLEGGIVIGSNGAEPINFVQDGVYVMQVLTDRTLSLLGGIVAGGNITAFSDRRLKSDIGDLSPRGMLRPRTYIKEGRREIGFIAQEVLELYPELVSESQTPERFLALNYQNLTAVLASQINDHETRIRQLENRCGYGK